MTTLMTVALSVYVALMYGLAVWVRGRVRDTDDFLVAGRRLPLMLSSATLLATWFGAGTMITAADEVRQSGLRAAALEPLGSGSCLILAGLFFAAPLWRMKLLTLADFFRIRFGARAEIASSLVIVPSYFGWIAVQFLALASMLELLVGIELRHGIWLVALVGTGYTVLGGMWSVTLTDAVQVVFLLLGLLVLGVIVLQDLGGGGVAAGALMLGRQTPDELAVWIPTENLEVFLGWVSVFCVAALGNIPAQDLMQRVFAARSAQVAKRACWLAGSAYILFGMIPVMLGLASVLLFPEDRQGSVLPLLAHYFLNPWAALIFFLALTSAVLSTIDSAILSPAAILGQNLFPRLLGKRTISTIGLTRVSILLVSGASLLTAYWGEDAYTLLEEAYALTLVGLLVPLTFGIYETRGGERAAIASITGGCSAWALHFFLGWEAFLQPFLAPLGWVLPVALSSTLVSLAAYLLFRSSSRRAAEPTGRE